MSSNRTLCSLYINPFHNSSLSLINTIPIWTICITAWILFLRLEFIIERIILGLLHEKFRVNSTTLAFVQAFHLFNVILRQSEVKHIKVVNDSALGDTLGNGDDTPLELLDFKCK